MRRHVSCFLLQLLLPERNKAKPRHSRVAIYEIASRLKRSRGSRISAPPHPSHGTARRSLGARRHRRPRIHQRLGPCCAASLLQGCSRMPVAPAARARRPAPTGRTERLPSRRRPSENAPHAWLSVRQDRIGSSCCSRSITRLARTQHEPPAGRNIRTESLSGQARILQGVAPRLLAGDRRHGRRLRRTAAKGARAEQSPTRAPAAERPCEHSLPSGGTLLRPIMGSCRPGPCVSGRRRSNTLSSLHHGLRGHPGLPCLALRPCQDYGDTLDGNHRRQPAKTFVDAWRPPPPRQALATVASVAEQGATRCSDAQAGKKKRSPAARRL